MANSLSEYEGGGLMPNTVFPKGIDALTPADKLRLQSITGQETDSRAKVDPYFWYGNVRPDPREAQAIQSQRQQLLAAQRAENARRYKETPFPY